MIKIGKKILFIFYLLVVVLSTIYILNLNRFSYAQFGNTSVIPASKNDPFKEGNLVIIKKNVEKIEVNDTVFYFDSYSDTSEILESKAINIINTNRDELTIQLDNNRHLSSEYLVGTNNYIDIPFIGYFVSFVTSRIGYLMVVILPVLVIFSYELKVLINMYRKKGE